MKEMQHKNINMSWNYRKFPHHPVASECYNIIGRNTIISHYHYRLEPNIGKGVCVICQITCACPECVDKLDK